MFTWICPQCGREVPPAYNDCPNCRDLAAQSQQPAAAPPPPETPPYAPPPPQAYPPPVQAAPPPSQSYPPPQGYPPPGPPQSQSYPIAPDLRYVPPQPVAYYPPPKRSLPVWLLTIFAVAAFGAVFAGIYYLVGASHGSSAAPAAAVENPAAKPGAAVSPLQKFVEISGVRFVDDEKHKDKALVKFLVVNHSSAEWTGVKGNVTLWGSTQRSEEDAQGSFVFTADLKPFSSVELTAPLDTKKKIYELADWQNVTADVQITSPAAPPGH